MVVRMKVGDKLTPGLVNAVFGECLFKPTEDTTDSIEGDGVVLRASFHPERLMAAKGTVARMLAELPDAFMVSGGGGYSFLLACTDRHGELWTGEHRTLDMLFTLGLATGQVRELFPRNMWSALPGGMPYYVVVTDEA